MRELEEILHQYWGYENFRPLQKDIIESVLSGKDTLAILPTGGGKSVCFQVPALASKGICIVISPLIALMKDQVENLKKRGIPALLIHSGMQRNDVIRTLKNATDDYFKFLYLSPERLETFLFREYLPGLDVNLIAVDESHCISQWGYDFRPSYLRIAALRNELPGVPVLALTASATPLVQQDICEKLEFSDSQIFRQSFERKNLSYSVFRVDSKKTKLLHILAKVSGSAIVYCKSRKRTQEIRDLLRLKGIEAEAYHAGLSQEERDERQQNWINNKNRVIVCTNAFGMGIDKPDVRLVVHYDVPDCLENYYQEAGRAGRDGNRAYAVLLYEEKDIEELQLMHLVRFPGMEQIRNVYHSLVNFLQIPIYSGEDRAFTFHFDEFVRNFKLKSMETLYALKALEQDGWLDFDEKNFTPSTLVFMTGKNELYQFEESYPEHEALLTLLLRTYEGVFDFPAFINEHNIARLMGRDEAEIKKQLTRITSYGIIRYVPQYNEPRIVFRKNRVHANELSFNLDQYNKRKDAFIERVHKMVEYVHTDKCRSQLISRYFGEADARACMVCDNCLEQRSKDLSTEEFEKIRLAITQLLNNNSLSAESIVDSITHTRKEKTWKVIDFLFAERMIQVNSEGMISLKNTPSSPGAASKSKHTQ